MFRLSLRGLLLLVALVALAIASLTYANDFWVAVVSGITMIAFFVALIVAVVDRGRRQGFAIGFVLTLIAYGLVLTSCRTPEFDQWDGRLPTTRLLRYVHRAVNRGGWLDPKTGQIISRDPDNMPAAALPNGGGPSVPPLAGEVAECRLEQALNILRFRGGRISCRSDIAGGQFSWRTPAGISRG
jgi:hypothetical protein